MGINSGLRVQDLLNLKIANVRYVNVGDRIVIREKKTGKENVLMFTLSFAASFGALLQAPQIVPGLPETQAAVAAAQKMLPSEEYYASLRAQWRAAGRPEDEIEQRVIAENRRITGPVVQGMAARVTTFQEMGGLTGRCALAVLAVWLVSRRRLLRCFLIPAAVVLPATFAWAGTTSLPAFESGLFLAGFLIIGQFSFWGNYLPRVYPLHLRGTGESFAANVGGRMAPSSSSGVIFSSFRWSQKTRAGQNAVVSYYKLVTTERNKQSTCHAPQQGTNHSNGSDGHEQPERECYGIVGGFPPLNDFALPRDIADNEGDGRQMTRTEQDADDSPEKASNRSNGKAICHPAVDGKK